MIDRVEYVCKFCRHVGNGFNRSSDMAKIAEVIYDTIINPELVLKVTRSDEAKEFPIIEVKKAGDVGYDIPCLLDDSMIIPPHCQTLRDDIKTGYKFQIPEGYWIELKARSSTGQLGILTPDSVIDEGYRGEIFPVLMNVSDNPITIHNGERLIQAILHKKCNDNVTIMEVDELDPSERGETGFGSTGRLATVNPSLNNSKYPY